MYGRQNVQNKQDSNLTKKVIHDSNTIYNVKYLET